MEAALAKNQKDKECTTQGADEPDQSGGSKEVEGVTTTVIGKPDWGEADKITEKPSEERKIEQEERKDTTSGDKGEDNDPSKL